MARGVVTRVLSISEGNVGLTEVLLRLPDRPLGLGALLAPHLHLSGERAGAGLLEFDLEPEDAHALEADEGGELLVVAPGQILALLIIAATEGGVKARGMRVELLLEPVELAPGVVEVALDLSGRT